MNDSAEMSDTRGFIQRFLHQNMFGGVQFGEQTWDVYDFAQAAAETALEAITEGLASGDITPKDLGMIQASGVIGVVFSNGLVGATSDPVKAAQHGEPVSLWASP